MAEKLRIKLKVNASQAILVDQALQAKQTRSPFRISEIHFDGHLLDIASFDFSSVLKFWPTGAEAELEARRLQRAALTSLRRRAKLIKKQSVLNDLLTSIQWISEFRTYGSGHSLPTWEEQKRANFESLIKGDWEMPEESSLEKLQRQRRDRTMARANLRLL